jgi:murein DD-endopeptidase MepM/ murein hydrolase activator NlpD
MQNQEKQISNLPNFVIEYPKNPKQSPKKSSTKLGQPQLLALKTRFLLKQLFQNIIFGIWSTTNWVLLNFYRIFKSTRFTWEVLNNPESRNLFFVDLKLRLRLWKQLVDKYTTYTSALLSKFTPGLIIIFLVIFIKTISLSPTVSTSEAPKSFFTQFLDKYTNTNSNFNVGRSYLTTLSTKDKKLENEQRIKKHDVQPGQTAQSIAEEYGLLVDTITINNSLEPNKPLPKTLYFPWQDSYLVFSKAEISPKDLSDKYKIDEKQIYSQNEDIINYENGKFPKDQAIIIPTKDFANIKKLEELQKNKELGEEKKRKIAEVYQTQAKANTGVVNNGQNYSETFSQEKKSTGFIQPTSGSISRCVQPGHLACDIANPNMPPVYAVQDAVVEDVYTFTVYGYGNAVVLNHGNGLKTLYAHLNSIYVAKGQSVSQGQSIGQMGNTGNSTGTHLHFEVIQGGIKQNPLSYLP